MTPAELLALSDERDQWTRRLITEVRAAYLAGADEGFRRGVEHGARIRQAEWPDITKTLADVPLAELELLRWGPGGRESHFIDRPADDGPALRVVPA